VGGHNTPAFPLRCLRGSNGNWDDGRDAPFAPPEHIDDLAFVDAVIADVSAKYDVDPSRIYAWGISNGGFFTNRLACERTDSFAAFGNVIASMPEGYDCTPSTTAPMLLMPGTEDPLVRYDGGPVASKSDEEASRGSSLSLQAATDFWLEHNECGSVVVTDSLPDTDPDDGSTVLSERWSDCSQDSEVWVLTAQGGGHGLPGAFQYLPSSIIGSVNQDIDGTAMLWSFFEQHQR